MGRRIGIRAGPVVIYEVDRVVFGDGFEFVIDDVQMASLSIGGIVSWSYVWYRPDGRLSRAETAEQISGLVMAMIQTKPERKGTRSAAKPLALIVRK